MKLLNYVQFIAESSQEVPLHAYHIPTYDECREMCDANDNFLFYESKIEIGGYHVSIFNYRLSQYSDFVNPVKTNKKLKAFELRGLTFVFNKDGSLYKRYLLLDKFFNVDQTPCSMYSVVKDYKIKNIYNKEDGSIASFIRLPNGKVLGKSKTSFQSDQAIEIQKIYDKDPNIKQFVDFCMDEDIDPIFEYVSPTNRIVVPYANTDLILLRMRDNKSGEYLDINDYSDKLDGISVAASLGEHTLDSIKEVVLKMVGKEGVIVQFENGKMVKIKSPWYCSLHGIYTTDLQRENTLIKFIVEETIDDVLAQLNDPIKEEEVAKMTGIVNRYIKKISDNVDTLIAHYSGDIKEFALKYSKDRLFPIAIGVIRGKDKIVMIKNKILQDTKELMAARKWIVDNS